MINKLSQINLKYLILINGIVMLMFMTINSFYCKEGLIGGDCVKRNDNVAFLIQKSINIVFSIYFIVAIDKKKWVLFLLNFISLIILYTMLATIHSITKAGI